MLKNYFLITIRTLRQNPLYTALSVFGIALTFVFVSVLFLIVKSSNGDFIPPNYTKRTWQIDQFLKDDGTTRSAQMINKEIYEALIPKINTPEITLVVAMQNGTIVVNDFNMMLVVLGVDDNYYDVCRFKFLRGRPINKHEIAESIPVAVVDENTANFYFGRNEDPIGKPIELNGIQYTVVGVVKNTSLFNSINNSRVSFANVWIPFGAGKQSDTRNMATYNFLLTAKDEASIAEVQAEFLRALDEIGAIDGVKHSISNQAKQSLAQKNTVFNAVSLTVTLLILMLIPALNILSLNVSKSNDRNEEIAIRKAFGAPKHTIFGQLLIENTLITMVGAIIGMCITPFLLQAIDRTMLDVSVIPLVLSLNFDWVSVLLVAGPCVLLFSFLSGSIPAWITAKREIVTVLKGEDHHAVVIGNRKRSHAWVFIEQVLVFAVLLFAFTSFSGNISRYFSKGYIRMDNIAAIGFDAFHTQQEEEADANHAQFRNMVERMKEWQSVELVSVSSAAIPNSMRHRRDTVSFRGQNHRASIRHCDENFYRMFSPKLSEGEWFRDSDVSEIMPALITQRLANDFGLTGRATGQTIEYDGRYYRITGIVEAFKDNATAEPLSALFIPVSVLIGTTYAQRLEYIVKYKPGMGSDFSKAFFAEFYRNFPRDQFQPALLDVSQMGSQMSFINFTLQLYLLGIPTAFLLIFAFLGTFGVVWMQSKKRMTEFGVRMAFGCTPARLQRSLIFENLKFTSLAMLPGLIVIANLYAYAPKGWEWIAAVGAAIVLMWLFSAFSAWYPAWKASRVQPVEALKLNQ